MRVFVYGTLKRGYRNHAHLLHGRSFFVTEDAIKGRLFDLGSYPAVNQDGDNTITGEIYEIGPNTLRDLDRLEGHPTLYQRRLTTTVCGWEVWVYFMDNIPKGAIPIENGSWHGRRAV